MPLKEQIFHQSLHECFSCLKNVEPCMHRNPQLGYGLVAGLLSIAQQIVSFSNHRCDILACGGLRNQSHCWYLNSNIDSMYFYNKKEFSFWTSKINTHHIIGWYHSHPSYGCWLSKIDVDTTSLFQQMNDPFISVVVDPVKSMNFRNTSWLYRNYRCWGLQSLPKRS